EGVRLPMLFLLREGDFMLVATSHGPERLAFETTLSTLEALGNVIADRLKGAVNNERAKNILDAWKRRNEVPIFDRVEIASGLSRSAVEAIAREDNFEAFWDVHPDTFAPNELMAAARMVGRLLSDDDTRIVVENVKSMPFVKTESLNRLSELAEVQLSLHKLAVAHEQGRLLAEWFRALPDVVEHDGTVDPERLLGKWNVKLSEIALKSENLDALCAWGSKHGPSIVINKNGGRAHFRTGRRSSLAHEICHLLVDRRGSLPLTEALGGEVPEVPEQRANAFAAE